MYTLRKQQFFNTFNKSKITKLFDIIMEYVPKYYNFVSNKILVKVGCNRKYIKIKILIL